MSTDKSAAYIDTEIYDRGFELEYLAEVGFRVKKVTNLSQGDIGWLQFFETDLVVMNPIMGDWEKSIGLVHSLREESSANRNTPIVAFSVLSDTEIIGKLQKYDVKVVSSVKFGSFRDTIDSLL